MTRPTSATSTPCSSPTRLFPHLDVYENVAFGLRRKKVDKGEIETRVKEAMNLVDLIGFETRKPPQMSGGQQQRVALARALVNHPKVLLLDEPLGALDLKLRKKMQLELKRIQQEVGITFIYVTHDQEEAMTMSDRLAVMRHGKIEQLGDPRVRLREPGDRVRGGVPRRFEPPRGRGQGIDRRARARSSLTSGGTVTLPNARIPSMRGRASRSGCGPEKVAIARGTVSPAGTNSIGGTVSMTTYIGVSHQYKVATQDGTVLTVYVQNLGSRRSATARANTSRWRGTPSTRSR